MMTEKVMVAGTVESSQLDHKQEMEGAPGMAGSI